jgi:O-acetyl-ADP-ribose deacetylase
VKERITLLQDDITQLQVDAIVNAANSSLLGGEGVDGAIHRAAGPELLKECRALGGCEVGEAKITQGYNLPAKYVIHTVGPVYRGGNTGEHEALASCYWNSLKLAFDNNLDSIAFPAISCGVYGYPVNQASMIACVAVKGFLSEHQKPQTVFFTCFDKETFDTYQAAIDEVF